MYDRVIAESPLETLRGFARAHSSEVFHCLIDAADREPLLQLIKRNGYATTSKFVEYLVKQDNVKYLILVFSEYPELAETPLIDLVQSQAMLNCLLDNNFDLNKVNYFMQKIRPWVVEYILTNELKVKVNPNAPSSGSSRTPFWRRLGPKFDYNGMSLLDIKFKKNFTEPVNINAQCAKGLTILHVCEDLTEVLKYNPLCLKNKEGQTAIEYRANKGFSNTLLLKYIETSNLSSFTTKEGSIKENEIEELRGELKKTLLLMALAEAKNKEYEAQIEQLRALLA